MLLAGLLTIAPRVHRIEKAKTLLDELVDDRYAISNTLARAMAFTSISKSEADAALADSKHDEEVRCT